MTVRDYQLLDPAVLECPYPFYEALRTEAPVYDTGFGFWLISRYDDVMAVVRDPERFSSGGRGVIGETFPELDEIVRQGYPSVNTLLTNDPPDHTRFRNLVNKAFTPKRVTQLEGEIRTIANQLVDAWINDGRVELVSQFSVGLPLTVIADALGVDRADMPKFKKWSDDAVAPLSGLLTLEQRLECARSRVEMQRYMVERIEECRRARRDDLLSDLACAQFDSGPRAGEELSVAELLNVIEQLLVAGNETTTKLITAGMLLLLEHPDQMALVRADHRLIPNLVEEALRFESPVQNLFRTTTVDVEIAGVTIPAGTNCLVMYGCANRDDGHFSGAARFDVTRDNARTHLAFGQGPHFCPGAALARAEGRIAFETLLSRMDNIAVATDNPFERELSMVLRGWKSLYLTFDKVA
jgi:cytochrome P450